MSFPPDRRLVVRKIEDLGRRRSMRRLIVNEFLTLDGVMQAPGGQDEDRSGGFEHGGWQQPYFDEIFAETDRGFWRRI